MVSGTGSPRVSQERTLRVHRDGCGDVTIEVAADGQLLAWQHVDRHAYTAVDTVVRWVIEDTALEHGDGTAPAAKLV